MLDDGEGRPEGCIYEPCSDIPSYMKDCAQKEYMIKIILKRELQDRYKMYKNITIERLRGIKHLKIEDFRQVNLFVGKNNCGKTTILEGLFLLTGPTNAELPLKINSFRNFNIIDENLWSLFFNKLDVNSNIEISGGLVKPKEKRSLTIKPSMKSVAIMEKTTIDKKSS